MKNKTILIMPALTLAFTSCQNTPDTSQTEKLNYPATKKVEQTDDYFGTKVSDPYRWLENDTSAETKDWVIAQNKTTNDYLSKIPFRDKIKNRLTEIINYPKYSAPFRAGEYYFFDKNDGLQNQSVTYFQKGLDGEPKVFLDPNKPSANGTVSAYLSGFSKDYKFVTYNVSQAGSDWQQMFVMEVATQKQLSDTISWVKFSGAAWRGNGFYYSRYDKPVAGSEFSNQNKFQKIYYHKIGDKQEKDELIYEDKKNPLRYHSVGITEDERFMLLYISQGTGGSEIYYADLSKGFTSLKGETFEPLLTGFKYENSVIDNVESEYGPAFLVRTNIDAPNYKIVVVSPKRYPESRMLTIIPEKKELLETVAIAGGKLFTGYLKDVTTRVFQYDLKGKLEHEIQLPDLGTASGFGGKKQDTILFYTFASFMYPPTIYKYDISSGKSEVFRTTEVKFNPSDYETKQVFYSSKDGTKIPIFIVHKKGIKMDGNNPSLLYAYGGFNINSLPSFRPANIVLLENGGIFAMANLRGGGEYGENWHKAGMLLNKQNVFDDFIAAAEYLIKEKYTSTPKLAIEGRSNGGLLVGACMTQRPDLFKVALPAVGVMDMLRFHKFTVGFGWVDEYGSSDSSNHFKNLYSFSPLHNIKENTEYPATLVTTADHDDRVVPAHSFKFISELQNKHKGSNPVLIRIETKAGHGAGKSMTKQIEERADIWAFMFYNMGIIPKY